MGFNKEIKSQKNVLIALFAVILGLWLIIGIMYLETINHKTPLKIEYFEVIMESLLRTAYSAIILGFLNLLNNYVKISKFFDVRTNDFNEDKFNQDDSYVIKSGLFTIQRQNKKIIILQSNRIMLKTIIKLFMIIIFFLYIAEPISILFITNVSLISSIFADPTLLVLVFSIFNIYVILLIVLALIYNHLKRVLHLLILEIDPETRQILLKRSLIYPLKIIWYGEAKVLMPIKNMHSLTVSMEPYKMIKGNSFEQKEIPFLTISTEYAEGNKDLLKKVTSRLSKDRIRILSCFDLDVLYGIKKLLENYTLNG